eukprot:s4952_g5.t1
MLEDKVMRLDSFAGCNKWLSKAEFAPEQLLHALCAAMGLRDRSSSQQRGNRETRGKEQGWLWQLGWASQGYFRAPFLEVNPEPEPCNPKELSADTVSALKLRVIAAIGQGDLAAALAANPKGATTAKATSPTEIESSQEGASATSPADTAMPPDAADPQEEVPPKPRPAAYIRVFTDSSFDVVAPDAPDIPVVLGPEERKVHWKWC